MKSAFPLAALACASILSFTAASADAQIIAGEPSEWAGGITYDYRVNLGMGSSYSVSAPVGAWSWAQDNYPANTGWTHTSTWYAVTLTEAATLTLSIVRDANVVWIDASNPSGIAGTANMNPAFSIYGGLDNDGSESHQYLNNGPITWAEDISYIGNAPNGTEPSISKSFSLPAGQYTIVIGSNSLSDDAIRQGYAATFSTSAPVPEPSSALLAIIGGAGMLLNRRRRSA